MSLIVGNCRPTRHQIHSASETYETVANSRRNYSAAFGTKV